MRSVHPPSGHEPGGGSTKTSSWVWILAALGAHTGWGAYPVLARYLQTVSHLPSMSLLTLGYLCVLPLLAVVVLPRMDRRFLRLRLLWLFAAIVVLRAITNLLASRYTLAIYVQLVTLMTPFVVALLSRALLREPIPPYTGRAITLSSVGALLMMSGNIGQAGVHLALTPTDSLGIALAFVSTFSLAVYMIIVRRTVLDDVPDQAILLVQVVTLLGTSALLSFLLGEDWSRWRIIGPTDWLVFGVFSLGVLLVANMSQIKALQHLSAPLVSSLLAWRLVSALLIAALLLGERLTSPWQGIGAVMVLVTITWYLWRLRGSHEEVL
jgi:drug/metabolite transporter (DMT)-like permease